MAQPDNLGRLSLEAIGKYFSELCCKIAQFSEVKSTYYRHKKRKQKCSVNIEKLKFTCRNFHRLLAEIVPDTLADDVTNKLLSCIDCLEIKNVRNELKDEIYEELIKCVIHPAATKIIPEVDFLDCSDIFPQNRFKNFSLVKVLVKNVKCLTNLKALNLRHSTKDYDITNIEYPPFLEEFSGSCDDESLKNIARACRFMKALNLYGLRNITNSSIATILQMENLEKLDIAHTRITSKGSTDLLKGLIEKGEASKLRCLTLSHYTLEVLRILETLPKLKISLKHDNYSFFLNNEIFKMSELYRLENLHGLQIRTSFRDLNDMLGVIGRQLVYLEIATDVDFEQFNNGANVEDVLLIGQYCTSLRCLHIEGRAYGFPSMKDCLKCPLPGFQTITCLNLEIESDEKTLDSSHKGLLYFLISQCVNVKKLTIPVDVCSLNKYEFICDMIEAKCMKNVEEVYFKNCCCDCTTSYENLDFNGDDLVVQKLIDHCPKLRIVGGIPGFDGSDMHNSQKYKFMLEALL